MGLGEYFSKHTIESCSLSAHYRLAVACRTGLLDDGLASHVTPDDSRELGVELGQLADELETVDYPVSNDELVDRFGDETVETSGGSEQVRQVLGPIESETYDDADAVRQMILDMVGDEAVGREGYSDRGQTEPGDSTDESL